MQVCFYLQCTSPLLDDVCNEPDSLYEMLGRAPRRSASPHNPREQSPSGHHTRLFEVIPAENRMSPCRSAISWSESRGSNLEGRALENRSPLENLILESGLTSLSQFQLATTKSISSSKSGMTFIDSSPIDKFEQTRESRHSSKIIRKLKFDFLNS